MRHLQDAVGNEFLPGTVALHDRLDQILGNIAVIGQQLLGVLGQTVAAVAEGWVVVVITDTWIEADPLNDGSSVQSLDLRIGIQLIEVGNAQGQVGIHEQLGSLCLRVTHEQRLYRLFDRPALEQSGKGAGCFFCLIIAAYNNTAGIEIVVQGLRFTKKFRTEQDVVHACFLTDRGCIADRNGGFDNHSRLWISPGRCLFNQGKDIFHSRAVEKVLSRIIIGRSGDDNKIRIGISCLSVGGRRQMQIAFAFFRLEQIFLDILILNR